MWYHNEISLTDLIMLGKFEFETSYGKKRCSKAIKHNMIEQVHWK